MEEVLFRFQRLERRPMTDFDFAWTMCLLAKTQIVTSKSSGTLDKKGNGAWIFLSPWSSGQLPGVRKIS